VASAIRSKGFEVLPMRDVYPNGADQFVPDEEWIERASDEGWIALTKDLAIVRDHTATLSATTLRVFALNNANLVGSEMAERFVMNLNRILQRGRKPGPYVYAVTANNLELRWPKPQV
jgi:PIN like domain